jgi:hypothetical protein
LRADHGIELAVARIGGEVAREFLERFVFRFGFGIADFLRAADFFEGREQTVAISARVFQGRKGAALAVIQNRKRNVIAGDIFVL